MKDETAMMFQSHRFSLIVKYLDFRYLCLVSIGAVEWGRVGLYVKFWLRKVENKRILRFQMKFDLLNSQVLVQEPSNESKPKQLKKSVRGRNDNKKEGTFEKIQSDH